MRSIFLWTKLLDVLRNAGILLLLLGIMGCANFFMHQRTAEASSQQTSTIQLEQNNEKAKEHFEVFVLDLKETTILEPGHRLFEKARNYFPVSTFHNGAYLFAKPLYQKDNYTVLFVEFSDQQESESWYYLMSFNPYGEFQDFVQGKSKSQDANLGISYLGEAIFEMVYTDFYLNPDYFETHRYLAAPDSIKEKADLDPTALRDHTWARDYTQTDKFEYFRLSDGHFEQLSASPKKNAGRQYRQASINILSEEELDRLSTRSLQYIVKEIQATHGLAFRESHWQKYFSRYHWYQALYDDVSSSLSDIERLNIQKIQKRLLVAKK